MLIWHSASIEHVEQELGTNLMRGLTEQQVAERLHKYGSNQLNQKKGKTLFQKFIEQLKDFMVIILMAAAAISFLTTMLSSGEESWLEPIVIVLIVVLNALLGVIQESKAEASLAALQNMSAPSARVMRDGQVQIIESSLLVPGDIILLESGDFIPADARLFAASSLHCEESALTGESVPVEKLIDGELPEIAGIGDRFNMVYSGCSVAYGTGRAIATDTGMNTEMGKIASILENTDATITPLQIKMNQLGKTLGLMALGICAFIFVFGMLTSSEPALEQRFVKMFMTAVSLAVAAIPEGLAAIVTVVLAIGVQRMVRKNAIIRRLPAVETLGSASVICSDKTGTLTQNRMTLVSLFNGRERIELGDDKLPKDMQMLLRMAAMCCDGTVEIRNGTREHIGDPTETAIIAAAMDFADVDKATIDSIYPRLSSLPFDSERKLMTTVNMIDGRTIAVVKGAPDVLVSRCENIHADAVLKVNAEMASDALRVLGVAYKVLDQEPSNPTSEELEHGLTFAGLLGMIDPPRPEAKEAIQLCRRAGIRTVMITGDHVVTASAIAGQLGMLNPDSLSITGRDLSDMSDDQLDETLERIVVYARVSPEDKIRIVQAWQRKGEIVAMTGDGVNDAPALKVADIGCAMGITGTDVAKGASDMVLTDDNFATIVTAVSEGRSIFNNIRRAIHFLLSCNIGEVLAVFLSMLFWKESPLLAIQILWVNLVTDGIPALALGMEPVAHDVMDHVPRSKDESVFAHGLGIHALWQGAVICVLTLIAFRVGWHRLGDLALGETMAFATLALSQLVHSFNVRSNHSLLRAGLFKNKWMIGAFAASFLMMMIVLCVPAIQTIFGVVPMDAVQWRWVLGLSVLPLAIGELVKLGTHFAEKLTGKRLAY